MGSDQSGRCCACLAQHQATICANGRRNVPAMIGSVVVVAANHIQARMPDGGHYVQTRQSIILDSAADVLRVGTSVPTLIE